MTTISISQGSCDAAYGALHEGHKVTLHLHGKEYPLAISCDPARLCHSNGEGSPVPIRVRALCAEADEDAYFDFIDIATTTIAEYKAAWKGTTRHDWELDTDIKEALEQYIMSLRVFCQKNRIPYLISASISGDGDGDDTAIVASGNMPSAGRPSDRTFWLNKIARQPGATLILAEAVATGRIDLDQYVDSDNQSIKED